MIPAFSRSGLLPAGEHSCRWTEFAARFSGTPDNGRRHKLMVGLAQMLFLLVEAGCQIVWVDGSFVTRERWPRDFDLCYDAQGVRFASLPVELRDMSQGRAAQKRRFGGEALVADLPFEANGHSIREAFARTREGQAKGVVRLELPLIRAELLQFLLDEQAQPKEVKDEAGDSHGTP